MKKIIVLLLLFTVKYSYSQSKDQLSSKVSVAYNTNLETYFFAEKLAVEHINDYVFDHRGWNYAHQPIVYYGFEQFKKYADAPVILRISVLLKQLRDTYHDNSQILNYLVNQKEYPAQGPLYTQLPIDDAHPETKAVLIELADSLRSFYHLANVASFLKRNAAFYHGAMKEVEKDIDAASFPALERWYGKKYPAYQIYIVPSMPITAGVDNYRGIGPRIISPAGIIPSMIMSSDTMLQFQASLQSYQHFGFNNPVVTHFLTKHEIGHSFINPIIEKYTVQIKQDTALFTPALKRLLAPHYINDWYVCVIEHLVRLGEIRTAVAMGDDKEANRLRELHVQEYKCVLLPLLETKIKNYEINRKQYQSFEQYLPQMIAYLHALTPQIINEQVRKYE